MNAERKLYVDYIKAIAIILTIVGHINFANAPLKAWIYSFHMPVFFFASGLTLKTTDGYLPFISKKFKSLLLPYLLWALIFAEFTFSNLAKIIYASYDTIVGAGSLSSLWFLPVLFAAILLVFTLSKWVDRESIVVIICLALSVLAVFLPELKHGYPFCLDVALIAALFIAVGKLGAKYITDANNRLLCAALFVAGLAVTLVCKFGPVAPDKYVLMANRHIGKPVIFLLTSVGGCIMVCFLAKLIDALFGRSAWLSFVGRNTLVIFTVQKPIISLFEKLFNVFNVNWAVELFVSAAGTLIIACIIAHFINKLLPCLSGK